MRSKKTIAILAITLIAGMHSCKKPASSGPAFTLDNNNGLPVNLDVYATETDYVNGTNVLIHTQIPANGSVNLPTSKLKSGTWYYYDAYSSDYSYTNWALDDAYQIGTDSTTNWRFKYTGVEAISVAAAVQANARTSLLKNTGTSSTWIAVDALDLSGNNSIWFSLSQDEQYAKLIINKNHTGSCYYISAGDTALTNIAFTSAEGYPNYLIEPTDPSFNFFMVNTNVNPDPGVSLYEPVTIDTAVTLLNGYLYIIVRQ